jgi:hypothetical protein
VVAIGERFLGTLATMTGSFGNSSILTVFFDALFFGGAGSSSELSLSLVNSS